MADNIDVTPGTGLKVATDEVADGSHVQIVKLAIATDGIKTLIPADSGGLLVNLGTNNDVVEASAADIKTAVEALDNAVDGNYLNVNNNIAGTDVAAGAGMVNAQTQRIIHASDDPVTTAVQLIDNAISGAGFNITQLAGASVPIGAGVEATAVRVTVATDSTGVLSIDDNGGSITVDGAVSISSASAAGINHNVTGQAETVASSVVTCLSYRELTIYFDITAITGTWRIDVRVYDPNDVQYYELFRSAEYAATGKTRITFPIADNKFDVNLVEVASGAITCSVRYLLKS